VPDGGCALTRICDHRPDLVLTDVDMAPGMSGLDLLTAIRADPEIAAIPVIVATGGRLRPDTAAALGATLLLPKPVSPRVLVAHVNTILAGNPGTTSPPGPAT
jgi:CheY-like chemotaxis protein